MRFRQLPLIARVYVLGNVVASALLFLLCLGAERVQGDMASFALLTALAIVANLPRVNVTTPDGKMTLSNTVIFLTIMLHPHLMAGVVVAGISAFTGTVFVKRPLRPDGRRANLTWYKPALSVANLVQSAFISAYLWRLAVGLNPPNDITVRFLIASLLLSGTYFLINTVGISYALAFSQTLSVVKVWQEAFMWTFPGYLCAVSAAAGAAVLYYKLGLASFLLLPPVYVVYYSYKLYLDKVQNELKHVHELNELNARVISTLAMTIEAKDRYTHKHVERVREYALGIARELHVTGDQLEAVKIGAMVHDIGKIAVPESILMKPGKLTPEEFERIKTHVLVGVKILEVVNFPFPVVDAVAAHHERWDGNGYPYGLKGEEIPLIGRIVGLADGFDALTSDRHYRKGMTREEAMELIASQAGQQYDPVVVEAMVAALPKVEPTIQELNRVEWTTEDLSGRPRPVDNSALEEIASAAEEAVMLAELSLKPNTTYGSQEVIDLLLEQAMRHVPTTTAAVFILDSLDSLAPEIRVKGCRGLYCHLFEDLSMRLDEGTSGRVAARGDALVNAPAANDLARRVEPGHNLELNSALSVPLQVGDRCIGAITLYHTGYNLYSSHHQRLLTTLAEHASGALDTLFQLETHQSLALTDTLTALPNMRHLIQHIDRLTGTTCEPFSVLLLDVNGFKEINDTLGHLEGDRVLRDVAQILRDSTRTEDLVARYAGDEFVIVCHDHHAADAARIAERIRAGFMEYVVPGENDMVLTTSIGTARFPADGQDWRTLLSMADRRMYSDKLAHYGHAIPDEPAGRGRDPERPIVHAGAAP